MLTRIIPFSLAAFALAACEGNAHWFRVPAASTGGPLVTEHRLVAIATAVAQARGYTQMHPITSQYATFTILATFTKRTSERESVTIELVRRFKDGSLRFIFLDWPSFTRSDESRAVEAAIRARLPAPQASNRTMQRTADRPYV